MKNLNLIGIAVISVLSLAACGEEGKKVLSTQHYIDNPSEIKKIKDKCKAERDKGYTVEGALKENCRNAGKARNKLVGAALG
ncbi:MULTISPECIES: EexN family lipoprotein [Psychrobacter]|uniref:EexN family lipoprotein n=1 Tax=Psychrobacter TaxID=497 RepID=UPI00178790FD|nr:MULTISPECIES: EexN family lipoprotein [unclassified Psychrobacter]MBE0406061.1 EexN family lipoprotein [Psychrobacter sp. FME6]MBE0446401.1 EexN family lipoprotein [Psychrobacter sp. FME5]